jgi:putative NADPH-quinone reductase
MRALLVYCNPNPESFSAHLRDAILAALHERGAETRVVDLYAEGFDPVMSREERRGYHTPGENEAPVAPYLAHLRWCDTLVFVYPTWWFGLPAILKGWLDRVLVPHATFTLPTAEAPIRPLLSNITTIAAVTTCGARYWQSKLIGEPGRRTLLRGIRFICHPRCRTRYAALYRIDSSSHEERTRFAAKVRRLAAAL